MQSSYIPDKLNIPKRPSVNADDVSPPESLLRHDGANNHSRRSSPDISPITDNSGHKAEHFPVTSKNTSSIPVLKKPQKFGGAGAMWSNWRGKGNDGKSPDGTSSTPTMTRWDEYSGERTTSEKGRPGQVSPGSIPFDAKPSSIARNQAFGSTTVISGGVIPPKRKKVPTRDEEFTPAVREEWKGASGRHKIINPLMDKPLPPGKTAVFPAGSNRRTESPKEPHRGIGAISPTKGLALSPISDHSTPTRENFRHPSIKVEESTPDYSRNGVFASPVSIPSPVKQEAEVPTNASLSPEDIRSPLARNPSKEEMIPQPQPPTPDATPNSSREGHSPSDMEKGFRANLRHLNLEDQPPSRFSATTYATTAYDSPPATPETHHETPLPTPPPSILNRKRPVPVAGLSNKKSTTRKPTPSEAEDEIKRRNSKSLPKSPPEVEAQTRVASLQAKLENLRRRKMNVQTVLHELTNVVQPSSIAYDIAARKEVKRTVEGLNKEMAEILKDEHETGLKLHRAWKRQDDNSAYEPTTLWVRRVTT